MRPEFQPGGTQYANVIAEIQLLQATELEGGAVMPWFLRKDDQTTYFTTPNQETVTVPADMLRPNENFLFWYDQTQVNAVNGQPWQPVVRDNDYGHMISHFATNAGTLGPFPIGSPMMYLLEEDTVLRLAPVPVAALQLRFRYYARQPVLTTNVENAWTKWLPDLFIATVGEVMATRYVQDTKLAATFAQDKQRALARYRVMAEAREHADVMYQMGDS